jgi:hypothetical protein
MIKVANNLNTLCTKQAGTKQAGTKQAFIGTTLSALLHAAAADDDEPIFRELLRGGAKGMGADVGGILGGLGGARIGYGLSSDAKGENANTNAVGGGALLGLGAGGTGGYLLMDKLIDRIGKKKQKVPAAAKK